MVNNPPIFNSGGEGNKVGDTKVTFLNPEDLWIPGLRWRELCLNKDHLEETTEAGFCASTTQEDFRVPPRKKYNFLGFLIVLSLPNFFLCGK